MELLHALSVQGRVISALTLRETRSRFGNRKLGFFWAFFEPLAHVAVFVAIFSTMSRTSPIGDNIGLFILTGIIPFQLFSNIVNNIMNGLSVNKALLGYPQVMPFDIVISRVLIEFVSVSVVFIFCLAIASYIGISIKVDNFLQMMAAIALVVIIATGVGMINLAILLSMPSYANIYSALSRPLYFMSGIFFTMDFLSPEIYTYLAYNPLLNMVEWFRSGFYTSFNSPLYDVEYTVAASLLIFIIGMLAERATSKKARQT
ncbi:MAG TPA: hypothetical protein EYH38_04500 [Leucothrix sp.]|nr:hypothetical protein [Leucothrix sp.]